MTIIDQLIGLCLRRGRGSPSAVGAGSFAGSSDKGEEAGLGLARGTKLALLSLGRQAKQTEAWRNLCVLHGCPCGQARCRISARPANSPAIENTTEPTT